jgi:hypothetical protein
MGPGGKNLPQILPVVETKRGGTKYGDIGFRAFS